MNTDFLFLKDQYEKEADSKVVWHEFTDLILDRSIFFPTGHGQPNDRGKVIIEGREYVVVDTWLDGDSIHLMSHDTFPDDVDGKSAHQILDWDVRYMHMRFRTALKILMGLSYSMFSATVRINQTYDDSAWMDLELDNITEDMVNQLFQKANEIVQRKLPVTFTQIPREQFMKDAEMMKICKSTVPDFESIRIMHLDGVPDQLEYGTNVNSTSEVGKINFKTNLVKGKISRRINITLE
ncbi:MAG: alanyl-tRNA editing protein [Candidatus Thermoplasmatota archaeon]|jgi:alanyl-tRNA synthetase/misacylated tRNA(Ala) deacylase|nr:alanyl-tRNA editing protein [Candidatus Thermoplasmatota archaeon]